MSITVSGGVGGAQATAEWLEAAARLVTAASAEVEGALHRVRVLDRLVDEAAVDSPATALGAALAIEPLHLGRHAFPARLHDLADLVDRLRAAAAAHRSAEAGARAAVGRAVRSAAIAGAAAGELGPVPAWVALATLGQGVSLLTAARVLRVLSPAGQALIAAGGHAAGVPGPLGWALRAVTGSGAVPEGAGLIPAADLRHHVMPFVGSWIVTVRPGDQDVPGRPVAEAAAGLARLNAWIGRAVGRDREGVAVALRGTTPSEVPVGAAGCLGLVGLDQPAHGGEDGQVSLRRIDFTDGTTSWLVTVPGTQDWLPGTGENVLDGDSNLEAVGRLEPDSLAAVSAAMTAAGVGEGDDVVVAGHSQGGIVAADLAVSLAAAGFAGRVMAVTAGSPVGAVVPKRLPAGVDVLAYNHTHDLVTGLQAGDNPTGPHLVTVERDLSAGGASGGNRGPGDQHSLDAYVTTAGLAAEGGDPSVAAAEARLADLLGADREVAATTRQVYVATRPPG